jgi:hypothetical protein
MSMRFLPKSRASMDRKPGPRAASAAPKVAKRIAFSRWLVPEKANQISTTTTSTPAMGVHSPTTRSAPAPTATDCKTIVCSRDVPNSAATPSRISKIPATSRRSRRALPGQALGNMENNRCIKTPTFRISNPQGGSNPQKWGQGYSTLGGIIVR